MKILAIDTSGETCSVAILEDDKTIKVISSRSEKEHSQTLMPKIKELFAETNLTMDEINLLACSRGPGSFTGIRIGMATIKAFSDAKNIPIAGVDSLKALAYGALIKKGRKDCKILSIIDAKKQNVYCAVYRVRNGNLSLYKNPEIMNISDVVEYIDFNTPLYIVGDDFEESLTPLLDAKFSKQQAQGKESVYYEYEYNLPIMAEAIGVAAKEKYEIGDYGDSNSLFPLYLRKPQAQRQKEGEDDKIAILELSTLDLEKIKLNYDKFPNSWNYKTLEEDYHNSKYIVAKQNNEIVGFAGTKTILDEMDIMNIVIRADKYNQGIASNMLSYLIRKNNVKKINLEVNGNNIKAIKLYSKFGFKEVGSRKKYYDGKDDAILMTL